MKYELKAIFRSKITMVCILILAMTGLMVFVGIVRDCMSEKEESRIENKRNIDYRLAGAEESVEDWEKNWDYYMNTFGVSEEAVKTLEAFKAYDEWRVAACSELSEFLENKDYDMTEWYMLAERFTLIESLAQMSMYSWEEKGYETPDVYFAKEMEKHSRILRLDELGFELSDLANSPFIDKANHELADPNYFSGRDTAESCFERLDYPDWVGMYAGTPYNYWVRLFSMYSYPEILIGVVMVLLACFYGIACRSEESRRLQELRPESRNKVAWHYYKSILVAVMLLLLGLLLIPAVALGCKNGWEGLLTPIRVDPANFTGWQPYEHNDTYMTYGISKVYSDFQYAGYDVEATLYKMEKVALWKFLLCLMPMGILKMLFLTLAGFAVGYIGKRKGSTLLAGTAVAGFYIVSQFVKRGMKWNPFSVKSAWDVVAGGTNMTGLNAIVVLTAGILLLAISIVLYNRKRDY